ncbi:MAG: serine/threonine protein kinase, partial [Actinomycetia bacterium]|nr:serine/threonine protein kinase [Actinomycetes bacterium]
MVWRGTDNLLGRTVAVKEILPVPWLSEAGQAARRDRMLREARAAAQLNHPGAITIHDVVLDGGEIFIVMELVEAPSLQELIERDGPLPSARVAVIGLRMLDVLEEAHRIGVIHRDVKPANVLVLPRDQVKLSDFGIAHLEGDPTLTATGMMMGSPSYMAPEQIRGEPASPSADLWGLGVTLYSAVEGAAAFRRDNTPAAIAAVLAEEPPRPQRAEPGLSALLTALLAKHPADRPPPDKVREALEAASVRVLPPAAPNPFAARQPPPPTLPTAPRAHRPPPPGRNSPGTPAPPPPGPSAGPLLPGPATLPVPPLPGAGRRRRSRLRLLGVAAGAVAVLIIGVVVLSSLSDGGTGTAGGSGAAGGTGAGQLKVGLVFTKAGKGDLSVNDSADRGVTRAAQKYGDTVSLKEVKPTAGPKAALDGLAAEGYGLIIDVDFESGAEVARSAAEHPKVVYALVGAYDPYCGQNKNLRCVLFKQQEGAFLVGAAAALKSTSHVVGFVGALPGDSGISQAGYQAGAAYVDRQKGTKTKVLVSYAGSTEQAWEDPAKGKALAEEQIGQGADVLFHDAGNTGTGVVQACVTRRKYVIGNDEDESFWFQPPAQNWILTSLVHREDTAVARTIEDVKSGDFKGGSVYLGLQEAGVDYAQNQYTKPLLGGIPQALD